MEMGFAMRRGVAVGAGLVLVAGLAPVVAPGEAGVAEAAQGVAVPFDFDGDGYADLAVGVPGEDLRGGATRGRCRCCTARHPV